MEFLIVTVAYYFVVGVIGVSCAGHGPTAEQVAWRDKMWTRFIWWIILPTLSMGCLVTWLTS